MSLSANISVMFAKLLQKKFAGVQKPLGRWIIRHVLEFTVLSPAILVTWFYLKLRGKEILVVGHFSNTISSFLAPLEPELRRRGQIHRSLNRAIVLNMSTDANVQVRKMYDRIVTIYGDEAKIRRRLVWWSSQRGIYRRNLWEDQSNKFWVTGAPSVSFTDAEEALGQKYLEDHGLTKFDYICYTVRTESYYLARISEGVTLKPQTKRNPSESTYLEVANHLASAGFKILRMGKDLDTTLDKIKSPNVIDYASDSRSDFLDVYLMRYCKFAFVGNTGIVWLRWLWNLPNVHGEAPEIRRNLIAGDLFILQKVWLKRECRYATFSEMFSMPGYSEDKNLDRFEIELVKNTAEEIKAACDEMNAHIDGTWITSAEDEELQRRYQELLIKYSDRPKMNGGGRVGTQFLRDNQDLLK